MSDDPRRALFGDRSAAGRPGYPPSRTPNRQEPGYTGVPSRPPRDQYPPPPRPPRDAYPPPQPQYDDYGSRGYQDAAPSQYRDQPGPTRTVVASKADNDRVFTNRNRSEVSPNLFPGAAGGPAAHQEWAQEGEYYLLIKDLYVVTARPSDRYPDGQISLNGTQRDWCGTQFMRMNNPPSNPFDVQLYTGRRRPLGKVVVNLDFASASVRRGEGAGKILQQNMYMQQDLRSCLLDVAVGDFFAPGQSGIMEFADSKNGKVVFHYFVEEIAWADAQGNPSAPVIEEYERGIMTPETDVLFQTKPGSTVKVQLDVKMPAKNAIIRPDFKFADMGIGGLDEEFSTIFRRAFASRVFPPGLVQQMGISHVKGILLYGPPGTGKTLIARQIGKMLNAREPKIINGPEILNKYVGQSEENVRAIFKDAEVEYEAKQDASDLHIIIFDELDAVCKQRGSTGGGTGVGDSVVNQLLTKLDGVSALNNILLIGMTNRKDMIDEALLRPGRLEVHMEISLPDEHGRIQILNIHTDKVRAMGKLSHDVDIAELAKMTKNFSGAELNGLVKAGLSYAFTRHTKIGDVTGVEGRPEDVMLTRGDFLSALEDVKPAYGVSSEELESSAPYGIVHYSPHIETILSNGMNFVEQLKSDTNAPLFSVLIHGPRGAGKTALAAEIGLKSDFPFVKLVRPIDVGTNEAAKLEYLRRIFADAYKSSLSMVILDRIETIIDWNPIGPRFSNAVVQYLSSLLQTSPPKGRRLLIIATTGRRFMLDQHEALEFDREIAVPAVNDVHELHALLNATGKIPPDVVDEALHELQSITESESVGVGVKAVFSAIETAFVRKDEPLASCLASELSEIIATRNPRNPNKEDGGF